MKEYSMKIASIQWDAAWESRWEESLVDIERLQKQIIAVVDKGAQVVVLPELFHSGFSMHPERFAPPLRSVMVDQLAQWAQDFQCYLIVGVAIADDTVSVPPAYRNSALVFNPQGELITNYIKQKGFSYAQEQLAYLPGLGNALFDIAGVPCSVFICYDLRFPELFRQVAKQVAIIFVIANWPEARQSHWEALLKARAIENQCFIVGVNRIGRDGNDLNHIGGSMVIDPLGEVRSYAKATDVFIMTEIETSQVAQVRQQFPFLQDM
jgi:predicted amidohydrolase